MLSGGHDLSLCRAVASELIGDHDTGWPHLPFQQLAQQPLRRALVAAALDQDVEHDAGLVHGSPQPVLYPGDFEHDLIQVPFVAATRQAATDLVGELLANFARPRSHRFVADDDAAGGQQFLDHTQPKREPKIMRWTVPDYPEDCVPRIF